MTIPGFEIEAEVGRGGMGIVYRAKQTAIGRSVAVKVLPSSVAKDPAFVEKFLKEAKAAARLNHENVVAAIDAGKAGDTVYFVMEFIDGETVRDRIDREGPLPIEEGLRIVRDTARALVHAQKHGLVHRDVKPDNIMIGKDGRALLCDLGLARRVEENAGAAGKRTGVAEGTPYYIAPEQAKGFADIDIRADIYALGATAYHMLAGDYAFDGEDARAIMVKQVHEPFPDIRERRPELPQAFVDLLGRMTAKERVKRPVGPAEVVAELDRILAALAPKHSSRSAEGASGERAARASPEGAAGGGDSASASAVEQAVTSAGPSPATLLALAGGAAALLIAVVGGWLILGGTGGSGAAPDGEAGSPVVAVASPPGEHEGTSATGPAVAPSAPTVAAASGAPPAASSSSSEGASDTAREAEAAMKLAVLRESLRASPPEPVEARKRWDELASRYPGTNAAAEAAKEIAAIDRKLQAPLEKKVERVEKQATDLAKAGDFAGAAKALATALEQSRGGPFEARLKRDLDSVESLSDLAVTALEMSLRPLLDAGKTAEAADRCKRFALRAAGKSVEKARDLEKRCREVTDVKVVTAQIEEHGIAVHVAIRAGDYAGAASRTAAALENPDWKIAQQELERLRREVEAARAAALAFEASWRGLQTAERADLPLLAGGRAAGKLVAVETAGAPREASLTLWEGGKDSPASELRAADLEPAWLRGKGLAPGKEFAALGNGIYLVYAGAVDAGADELRAAKALGGVFSASLERVFQAAQRISDESLAEAIHRRGACLGRIGKLEDALAMLARILPKGEKAGTAYARAHAAEIGAAWKEARAAQLLQGPVQSFFGGKVEGAGARFRVRYDFETAAELADWVAAPSEVMSGSFRRKVPRGVEMHGRVAWRGAIKGEIGVDVGVLTGGAGGEVNANVVVYDKGRPWDGWLCGIHSRIPGFDRFNLSKNAPRNPGALFDAPKHVIVGHHGGDKASAEFLFAAQGPVVPSGGFRLTVAAKKRVLAVSLMSKPLASVAIPEADMQGGVAIEPFDKDLLIEEVRIAGELDEAWLKAEAGRIAEQELTSGKRSP